MSILGVLFVVIGVAGEGFFEAKQASAETEIRAYDESRTEAAILKAGSAEQSAQRAAAAATQAGSAADEALSKAKLVAVAADKIAKREEETSSKVQTVEGHIARRTIDPKKRADYVNTLKPFHGAHFYYDFSAQGDTEAEAYRAQIESLFRDAGWIPTDTQNYGGPTAGLKCRVGTGTPQGMALAKVLEQLPDIEIEKFARDFNGAMCILGRKTP